DVDATGARRWRIDAPPRLGWLQVELPGGASVRLRAAEPGTARVSVRVACAPRDDDGLRAWLDAAQQVSASLVAASGGTATPPDPALLERLADTAPDPVARAYAIHLAAQPLYSSGRAADAAPAFLTAASEWEAAGLPHHALAARVGAAEDFARAGRHAETLAVAEGAPAGLYYGARLQAT